MRMGGCEMKSYVAEVAGRSLRIAECKKINEAAVDNQSIVGGELASVDESAERPRLCEVMKSSLLGNGAAGKRIIWREPTIFHRHRA